MSALSKIGAALVGLGVVLLVVGFILGTSPETVERTVTVPHEEVLVDDRYTIDPGHYIRIRFSVPPEAKSAYLDLSVTVYSGNDVMLYLYHGSTEIMERKVIGSYTDTLALNGAGNYALDVDNTFSFITSKDVHVKAVLRWSEHQVKKEQIQEKGWSMLGTSIFFIIAGSILYFVGKRAETPPESVSLVLVDLAKRKPPEESGVQGEAFVTMEMKGLDKNDAEQLFKIVAENRHVNIHRKYSWFTSKYNVMIKGDKQRVVKAAEDIVEFCERTKKCKSKINIK